MGGEYLTVTSNKGAQPYISSTTGTPMIGAMSYDPGSQQMKVYDGNGWLSLGGGSATVNLTPNAISALKWAEQKMYEEQQLNALAATNPTIKDLVDQVKTKQDQIKMVQTLLKSSGNEGLIKPSLIP